MITLNTETLKNMVSKSIKGASLNRLLPITSLMSIEVKDKQLILTTTDASNTLYVKHTTDVDDFCAVVYAEQFSKLISRLTTSTVSLDVKDSILIVKANGEYKLELPLDENGEMIKFPNPHIEFADTPTSSIALSTIKTILTVNKVALAVTSDEPCYMNYYAGDRVVSTDREKLCGFDTKLFDEPVLVAYQTMNLLDTMTADTVDAYVNDTHIKFVTDDCVLVSHKAQGIDSYAIDAINGLLDAEFTSSCELRKADLISALERIALFVGPYDNNAITLEFGEHELCISSKQSNGIEQIAYADTDVLHTCYTCQIAIDMMLQLIKSNTSDVLHLQYANDCSLKLTDDEITQVIALLE